MDLRILKEDFINNKEEIERLKEEIEKSISILKTYENVRNNPIQINAKKIFPVQIHKKIYFFIY